MMLKLFLGFSPDTLFRRELEQINPYLRALFVGKEEYLEKVTFQGRDYLGKYLSSYPTLEDLDNLEKHLLSLLKQLTPSYPFSHNAPVLITLPHG